MNCDRSKSLIIIIGCFMECQVLAEFVRVLKISRKAKIEAPLLQYLSIMIQNMENEQAISVSNKIDRDTLCLLVKVDGVDQTRLDHETKSLQSYVKEKTFIISEKGALADKTSLGVLRSLVTLTDKPKEKGLN